MFDSTTPTFKCVPHEDRQPFPDSIITIITSHNSLTLISHSNSPRYIFRTEISYISSFPFICDSHLSSFIRFHHQNFHGSKSRGKSGEERIELTTRVKRVRQSGKEKEHSIKCQKTLLIVIIVIIPWFKFLTVGIFQCVT